MRRAPLLCLFALLLLPIWSPAETADEALLRATAAVEAAAPRAEADLTRPIFHVTAPAQWINDPNGPIFHDGVYHMFYQLHPFSDESGTKHWGHVRSRDLVRWEHLPIALAPSNDRGEAEIWSGCCTINGQGKPMIFYTSIAQGRSPFDHSEQWAATSDDDLIHWQKSPANPVLSESLHGGTKVYDWRDPFIFREDGRTFMVLGGSLNESRGGQAVVLLYEAVDSGLTEWTYRGVLFQHPDAEVRTAECPNFFKLGKEWVLLVSPYGKVQYFVGSFDPAAGRFEARSRGLLDFGSDFYAPNTMLVPDGRRIVWGWIRGFPGGHGWNGCLSLPRLLSISRDGELLQKPAPQLGKLRGKRVSWRRLSLAEDGQTLLLPNANTLEIRAEFDLQSAQGIELRFQNGAGDAQPMVVGFNGSELTVAGARAALSLPGKQRALTLRIFLDRSVLEVFANETACATRVIAPLDSNSFLEIRSARGAARAQRIEMWPMSSIWQGPTPARSSP